MLVSHALEECKPISRVHFWNTPFPDTLIQENYGRESRNFGRLGLRAGRWNFLRPRGLSCWRGRSSEAWSWIVVRYQFLEQKHEAGES